MEGHAGVVLRVGHRAEKATCWHAPAVALLGVVAACGVALGRQAEETSRTPTAEASDAAGPTSEDLGGRGQRVRFTLTGSGEHILAADIDETPGEVSITTLGLEFRADITLNGEIPANRSRATVLSLGVGAAQHWYDFDDASGLIPGTDDPFDSVQEYSFNAFLLGPIDERWSYQLGGFIDSAGAEDADFGDTLTYGGLVGGAYSFNPRLTLGAAVLVRTQLEDDALVIPVPVVRWQLSDEWLLATLGPRVELSYQESPAWRFGAFVGFGGRSIRLGDDSALPGAVFNQTRVPVGAFVEWTPSEIAGGNLSLRGSVAGHLFGSIETLTPDGSDILDTDVDPALGFGLDVVVRF